MSTTDSEIQVEPLSLVATKDALDSLRSPENSEFGDRLPGRESIATSVSELDDIALDDDEPSPSSAPSSVLPTGKPTSTPESSLPQPPDSLAQRSDSEASQEDEHVNGGPVNGDVDGMEFELPPSHKSHQKSASITTIRSGRNLSFIEDKRRSTRISLDGQQALQEEFSRLQKEKRALQEQGAEGAIDWGESLAFRCGFHEVRFRRFLGSCYFGYELQYKQVLWNLTKELDYQGFAAERPEELAQAIAKGIPAALRGMMWQHMLVIYF